MSSFSVELDRVRLWRYAFEVCLWEKRKNKFGLPVDVLLDTGSFNTIIHKALVPKFGTMLKTTMMTSVGGYKGEASLCILDKINIGGHIIEKVVAIAVPFEGELKEHILLGANVTNNWELTLSRMKNKMEATEQLTDTGRKYPYRYCFDNKGRIMALQEMEQEP
ncbi:MAG: retroviral-like aspartic protease family protein [Defluviitaleaceae bacterium]|nr:retroviral-like aspartic protease family protein [Defluviitaleaceae bacterium]